MNAQQKLTRDMLYPGAPGMLYSALHQQAISHGPAAKAAAMEQRLIAYVYYGGGIHVGDSCRLYYSLSSRGAEHHPKAPLSYQPRWYSPLVSDEIIFAPESMRKQYVKTDSIRSFPAPSSAWWPLTVQRYQYDAADNLAQLEDRESILGLVPPRRFEFTRNAAGLPVDVLVYEQQSSAMPYELKRSQHTTYNAQGLPQSDSICLRDPQNISNSYPDRKFSYTYLPGGMLESIAQQFWYNGMWNDYERYTFSYNSDSLVQRMLFEDYQSSTWRLRRKDSFSYAGNNAAYVHMLTSDYTSSSWQGRFRIMATLNADGLWDQLDYSSSSDGTNWQLSHRYKLTYNSYNNWSRRTQYLDVDNDGQFETIDHHVDYHYELYNNPASVPEASAAHHDWQVSPNPVGAALAIKWSGKETVPAGYALTDAGGRVMMNGRIAPATTAFELPMDAMPTGLYILTVCDRNGAILHRGKVIKQ